MNAIIELDTIIADYRYNNVIKNFLLNIRELLEKELIQKKYTIFPPVYFEFTDKNINSYIVYSIFCRNYRIDYNRYIEYQWENDIANIEYVLVPELLKNFNNKRIEIAKKHNIPIDDVKTYFLFHGTNDSSANSILKNNFSISEIGKGHGDLGVFGKGIYFSDSMFSAQMYALPRVTDNYLPYQLTLIISLVITGKSKNMDSVSPGSSLSSGYDSHIGKSNDGDDEIVIFDKDMILPMYKISSYLKEYN